MTIIDSGSWPKLTMTSFNPKALLWFIFSSAFEILYTTTRAKMERNSIRNRKKISQTFYSQGTILNKLLGLMGRPGDFVCCSLSSRFVRKVKKWRWSGVNLRSPALSSIVNNLITTLSCISLSIFSLLIWSS